jgi:AraC-like DNA-binding protein
VECIWSLESQTPVAGHRVAPDGCLDFLYERGGAFRVIGTMTLLQHFDLPSRAFLIGIRFRPGMARPFLGVPAAKFTDGSIPLADLWPHRTREWTDRLDSAKSAGDARQIMLSGLPVPFENPNPVQRAVESIAAAHGSADLQRVAEHANLSPRQFRRRVLEESGLTPKLLSRVLRFRHASRLALVAERPDWSAIAAEAEYFDQAHLIHDFRSFTGRTPVAVFSNTQLR